MTKALKQLFHLEVLKVVDFLYKLESENKIINYIKPPNVGISLNDTLTFSVAKLFYMSCKSMFGTMLPTIDQCLKLYNDTYGTNVLVNLTGDDEKILNEFIKELEQLYTDAVNN